MKYVTPIPLKHSAVLVNLEGPSGVGKTTLWSATSSDKLIKLPEYTYAQSLLGRALINPHYPYNEDTFLNNERFFARLELEYWHTQAGYYPQSASNLLMEERILLRDRGFFGAIAFTHACHRLFQWGKDISPLGSYDYLIRQDIIPCPDYIIGLTAPISILYKRLSSPNEERHPVWSHQDLLAHVNDILLDLISSVYGPVNSMYIDQTGSMSPAILETILKNISYDSAIQGEIKARLLQWSPPKTKTSISFSSLDTLMDLIKQTPSQTARIEHKKIPAQDSIDQVVNCYSANPAPWRFLAQQHWNNALSQAHDDGDLQPLPLHFIDRHGYLLYRSHQTKQTLSEQDYETLEPNFDTCRLNWIKSIHSNRTGVITLKLKPPELTSLISRGAWITKALENWREYLAECDIRLPPDAFLNKKSTWLELYKRSAHYPMRGPAILGPSFYDRLNEIGLEHFHCKSSIDLLFDHYQLLLQTHEESHQIQSGEPMLAEVMLSWHWCHYLTKYDMWYWQEQSPNGVSFNRERAAIKKIQLTNKEAGVLYLNQYEGVRLLFKDFKAYDLFCEGAWRFDHGYFKYQNYLDFVVWCFKNRLNHNLTEDAYESWFNNDDHR